MHAARNISLCNKDCVCLFVCPTGATDTENGQIDFSKCLSGCRLCVDACPSHAIYLVQDNYAEPGKKSSAVSESLHNLASSKTAAEMMAADIAENSDNKMAARVAGALAKSNRILAEDCFRESGFMIPQSEEVKTLLQSLLETEAAADFPKDAADRLLELLED